MDSEQILFMLHPSVVKIYIGLAALIIGFGHSYYLCTAGSMALLYSLFIDF